MSPEPCRGAQETRRTAVGSSRASCSPGRGSGRSPVVTCGCMMLVTRVGTTVHLRKVPTAGIARWLGHADVSATATIYAHSQDDALAEVGRTLAEVVTTRDVEAS